MKHLLAFILLISTSAFALEVDEKLTVRILRTSETRKTVMVNRGTEDGLIEGDHAKFIVTAGIVARGVCIKVSPARSVWSLYRLVNADFIVNDSVMSIKITPAVKITKDDTKNLVQEDIPSTVAAGDGRALGIPLAEGAEDLDKSAPLKDDSDDLKSLADQEAAIIPEKKVEVFSILTISGLTANTKTDTGSSSFNNSQSYHHIGLGGELYPQNEREWYSRFSLIASVNLMRLNNQSYNGAGITNDVTEFSFGANWHPTKLPSKTVAFIPYLHASLNLGSVRSTYKSGNLNSSGDVTTSANGGTQGFSLGFGYKFYTAHGYGARFIVDYYLRTERYGNDDSDTKFNKTVGGPRFMIGLGYRF
jgi:hypothetical protein